MLERASEDIRLAARGLLRRDRGATLIAILSLGLGIAGNATVFSLVQAVEFPRLIYPDSSRIVFLESDHEARGLIGMPVSAPDALDIAEASTTLQHAALTADQSSVLYDASPPFRISGRRVTPAFFDVMAVEASIGRVLRAGDGTDTVVVSQGLWRSAFGSDPAIAGRRIRIDESTVTVAGVMPDGFDGDADFWILFDPRRGFGRDDRQLTLFARLAPGASAADAAGETEHISRRLADAYPATNRGWTTTAIPLPRVHGRDSRGAFLLLQGAVLFVLLIACANIANILLARGTRRRHELAVRVSLGASRGRLVSALLIESLLLSAIGGALGVLLSMWAIPFARVFGGFPDAIDPTLNVAVLGFAAGLTVVTGALSGIVPALRASAVRPASALRYDDGRAVGATGGRLRSALVAVQIASALVLATAATLMVRTLINRERVDLGFEPRGAIRADLVLAGDRYGTPSTVRAAVDSILGRLKAAQHIDAAGAATFALPSGAGAQRALTLPAARDRLLPPSVRRGIEAVTPDYFRALGVPIRSGRGLSAGDREGSMAVAVVNEELARHLWPGRDPVGEILRLGSPEERAPLVTIVGVAGSIRRSGMHDVPVARVYVPFAQYPGTSLSLVIRGRGALRDAEHALQQAVTAVDPRLFAEGIRTLDADVAQFVAPIRMIGVLLAAFGVSALLLAALGVFGTMSYVVSQRERELAVRTALGAARRDIFRLVFSGALRMTAVGLGAGILLTLVATRALGSLLYGVSPADPLTFAGSIAVLAGAALAACYRPARVAAAADPVALLRQ